MECLQCGLTLGTCGSCPLCCDWMTLHKRSREHLEQLMQTIRRDRAANTPKSGKCGQCGSTDPVGFCSICVGEDPGPGIR
jgi:hypothetical protein